MKVVDASVAIKWMVQEVGSEAALDLAISTPLMAPGLLRAEVGNGLVKKCLRGDIAADNAIKAFAILDAMIDEWTEMSELADTALSIALELGHPIYDCYYLALAERNNLGFVTADQRLLARCAGSRFSDRLIAL